MLRKWNCSFHIVMFSCSCSRRQILLGGKSRAQPWSLAHVLQNNFACWWHYWVQLFIPLTAVPKLKKKNYSVLEFLLNLHSLHQSCLKIRHQEWLLHFYWSSRKKGAKVIVYYLFGKITWNCTYTYTRAIIAESSRVNSSLAPEDAHSDDELPHHRQLRGEVYSQ